MINGVVPPERQNSCSNFANPPRRGALPCLTLPGVLSSGDWRLAICIALLGGNDGGPRIGVVGGANRSGPPVRSVDGRAHPPKPRVGPIGVVIGSHASRTARVCRNERKSR
jgi:hypothetical protein